MLPREQLKQMSKECLAGSWNQKALMTFIYFLIKAAVGAIVGALLNVDGTINPVSGVEFNGDAVVSAVCSFVVALITAPIMFGYTESFMKTRIGEKHDLNILFSKYSSYKKIAVFSAVFGVIEILTAALNMVLSRIWIIGAVLMIVVFVFEIWLFIRLSMTKYILIENPYTSVGEAFHQSFCLTEGSVMRIFVMFLSFLGWILLSIFSLFIGMLWIEPYMEMTFVNLYYDLKFSKTEAA